MGDDPIDRYEIEQFWKHARESLVHLRADPVAWQDYLDDLAEWDTVTSGRLENEEPYYTPEDEKEILDHAAS